MSDWGDDAYGWPEPDPTSVDERTGEVRAVASETSGSAKEFTPDLAAVLAADAQVAAARRTLDAAEGKLSAADDALADADDEVGVAETKAEDYSADDAKQPWQIAAAQRDVAKRTRARGRAQEGVAKAQAAVDEARLALGAAEAQLQLAMATPAPPEPEEPELYYGSVDEFVREYLRNVYKRKIDGKSRVWAARWWEYDEAVIRLEALWRAWEFLRRDPATGMSVWWRDHADHHMGVLMDPQGPFAAADAMATENQTSKGAPLPYEAPPEGLFPDVRELDA